MEFPSAARLYPPPDHMMNRLVRAPRKHDKGIIPSRPRYETDIVGHIVDVFRADTSYEGKRPIGDAHTHLINRHSYVSMSPTSKRATLTRYGAEIEVFDPLYLLIPVEHLRPYGTIEILDLYAGWGERLVAALVEPRIFHYTGFHANDNLITAFSSPTLPLCLLPDSRISLNPEPPPSRYRLSNIIVFAPPYHGYDELDEPLERDEWEDEILESLKIGIESMTPDGIVLTYLRDYTSEVSGETYNNIDMIGAYCQKHNLHLVTTFYCGDNDLVCAAWKK